MSKKSSLFQFTQTQLDGYIKDENSCVKRVPSKMHIGFPPYGLENFKETLLSIISKKKIGSYDDESRGIVLDVRNIKLEGTMSHIRYDSPELHMDIFANFYVFQPHLGALLKGTVKHISKRHVSALIYNVFNVSIRLNGDFMRKLQVNKEISFRVKKFDLQNVLPYIEGELVVSGKDDENGADSGIGDGDRKNPGKSADAKPNKKNSFADTADSSSDDDSEDEKAFKSLVVKTESMTKATAASSSSEGESESSEEEEEKPVVPAPILVKKESSAVHTTSSSDESSDDEEAPPPIPKPLPEVKTEKSTPNKKKNGGKKSSSDSSSESESEEETSVAYKFPPSQFHAAKPAATIKQESSSDDSDSSSDEEQFKIPLPIVKQEGGQVVVKREMTPSRQDGKKDSSSSSSQSESDTKKPEKVKRKILQATPEKSPPKKSKSSDKESENINASKSKKTKKLTEKQKKLVKTPKTTPAVVVASRPAASSSSDSSSDSEDDESAINLNNTIQNMAQKILANKSNPTRPTAAAKAPKSLFGKKKSSGPETSDTEPAEKKKKPSKKAKIAEGELSCFGADVLSSTRLDSASPMAKPKIKKLKK